MALSKEKIDSLHNAITDSNRRMGVFRDHRRDAIKDYVGQNYGPGGSEEPRPINNVELAISTLLPNLAPRNPVCDVTTHLTAQKPLAADIEFAVNASAKELGLGRKIKTLVLDSLLGGMGILKIALERDGTLEFADESFDTGKLFAEIVSLDDFFWDMDAKNYESCGFIGNRYRMHLDDVKNSDSFKNTKDLEPTPASPKTPEGGDRADTISRERTSQQEFIEYIDLMDVWLPGEGDGNGIIVTLVADGESSEMKPLREIEWTGPEHGPYRLMSFSEVPDQIMPLRQHAHWKELDKLINSTYRKLSRQAKRQRNLTFVRPGAQGDAQNLKNSIDGEIFQVDDPSAINQVSTTGPDSNVFGFTLDAMQQFNLLAGNIEAIGGLGPQAETATQDRMLLQSASQRVNDMQHTVLDFVADVFADMAWYMFYDPTLNVRGQRSVARIGDEEVMVDVHLTPESLEGSVLDFNFKIAAHSVPNHTPAERAAILTQILQGILLPALPILQSQGLSLNMRPYLKFIGDAQGIPELAEMIVDQAPEQEEGKAETPQAGTRTTHNVRENRQGSTTRGAQTTEKVQALMSGGQNGSGPVNQN